MIKEHRDLPISTIPREERIKHYGASAYSLIISGRLRQMNPTGIGLNRTREISIRQFREKLLFTKLTTPMGFFDTQNNNTQTTDITYYAKLYMTEEYHKNAPCFSITDQIKGEEIKSLKSVGGYLTKIELYDWEYKAEQNTSLRLHIINNDNKEEVIQVTMGLSGPAKSLIASLDNIENFKEHTISIGLYTNSNGYAAVSLRYNKVMVKRSDDLDPTSETNKKLVKIVKFKGKDQRDDSEYIEKLKEAVSERISKKPMFAMPEPTAGFSGMDETVVRFGEETTNDVIDDLPF